MLCKVTKITLPHGCSPVNLLHIFMTPFTKTTSGRMLLIKESFKVYGIDRRISYSGIFSRASPILILVYFFFLCVDFCLIMARHLLSSTESKFSLNFILNAHSWKRPLYLTHSLPMHPFSTPLKHQKRERMD